MIRVPEFYPMNTLEQSWMAGRYFSEFFANDQKKKFNSSLTSLGTTIIYYFIQNIVNMPFYYYYWALKLICIVPKVKLVPCRKTHAKVLE